LALNEILKHSQNRSLPVADGAKSGDPVRVGIINGVAQTDEGDGQNKNGFASIKSHGAWKVPVTGAVTSIGEPIYIDGTGTLSTTATGDLWGAALQTQATDGEILVEIVQHAPATVTP